MKARDINDSTMIYKLIIIPHTKKLLNGLQKYKKLLRGRVDEQTLE
jgi:hypothetical protein